MIRFSDGSIQVMEYFLLTVKGYSRFASIRFCKINKPLVKFLQSEVFLYPTKLFCAKVQICLFSIITKCQLNRAMIEYKEWRFFGYLGRFRTLLRC